MCIGADMQSRCVTRHRAVVTSTLADAIETITIRHSKRTLARKSCTKTKIILAHKYFVCMFPPQVTWVELFAKTCSSTLCHEASSCSLEHSCRCDRDNYQSKAPSTRFKTRNLYHHHCDSQCKINEGSVAA